MTPPRLKPIIHEQNVTSYGDPSAASFPHWNTTSKSWDYTALQVVSPAAGDVIRYAGTTFRNSPIGTVIQTFAPPWPAFISGNWYGPPANTDLAMIADRLYLVPIFIPSSMTIDDLGISVAIASGAGTDVALGIYSFDRATLLASGTVATDATGSRTVSVSVAVTMGTYWLAALFESTPTVTSVNRNVSVEIGIGYGTVGATIVYPCLYGAQAWASGLPADASSFTTQSTTAANYPPAVRVRT